MYKLIVVDDEKNAIEGLKILIDSERNNISEILSANNAIEALEIIEKELPDIIISDISMPQITGLEMIAKIKDIPNYSPMIIILSGYSTFSYAQEALSQGVKAYLLKPVDEDELNDKIEELIGEIESEKQVDFEKHIVKYGLIQRIINGEKNEKITDSLKKLIGISKDSKYFIAASQFTYPSEKDIEMTDEAINDDFYKISELFHKTIKTNEINGDLYMIRHDIILTILWGEKLNDFNTKDVINSINKNASDLLDVKLPVVFDTVRTDFNDFPNISTDIINSIENSDNYFSIDDTQLSSDDFKEVNDAFSQIASSLDTMYKDELKNKLDEAIDLAIERNVSIQNFSSIFTAFLINITRYVSKVYENIDEVLNYGNEIARKNQNKTLAECQNQYKEKVFKLYDKMNEQSKKMQNETFYNIITFVNNNFTDSITLKSLANKFYVNPIYLGRVFKKNTGSLFHEYLTNLRIEKSKLLLLKTTKKVYEIATEVGFNDPNYFISKFLKCVGETPAQFRKKNK